jgi:hypothetical protein
MSKQIACERCAALEQRVQWLESQLEFFDPSFAIKRALPNEREAASLLKIVTSRYPHMKEQNASEQSQVENFLCALAYVMSLKVTEKPTITHAGPWWTSQAEIWSTNARMPGRPRTLLPAIICLGLPYVLDHSVLYVDPHRSRGTAIDRTAWRRLLNGGDIRPATPIKQIDDRSIGAVKVGGAW